MTYHSSVDNLRPIVPRGIQKQTAVLGMRGKYNSYTDYDCRVVGVVKSME